MAAGRTLTVNLVANTNKFGRGMMSAVKNAEGFRGKVGAVAASLKTVLGPALLAAAAAAGALAIKMGVDGVKAAMSNERTSAALAKTLENLGKAHEAAGVEQFIAQLESSTGIIDDDLRPALGRLIIATGDVGQAQDLLTKSLDVAVGTGKEFTGVVDAVAKAVQTRTAGQLSRYGVILDDNTLKTEGFTTALNDSLDAFRGLQQAEARSLEGQLKILQVEADNVKEAFGRGLLSAFEDSRGGLDDLSQSMRDMQPIIEDLGRQVGDLAKTFSEMASNDVIGPTLAFLFQLEGPIPKAWRLVSEATSGAEVATEDYRDAAVRAHRSGVDFTGGMEDLAEETEEAADALANLNGWISRTQTVMAYQAAWDDLRESVKENGKRFDIQTEKGRENVDALIAAAKATADYALSQETAASKIGITNSGLDELEGLFKKTKMDPATRAELLAPFQELIDDLAILGVDVTGLQTKINGLRGKTIDIKVNTTTTGRPPGVSAEEWYGSARGGLVKGRGGAMADMIPMMLSNGEFVMRAQAVNSFGADFFEALNRGINPLAGMDAPGPSRGDIKSGGGLVINGGINVVSAPGEKAEESVPRALRKLAFVAGI